MKNSIAYIHLSEDEGLLVSNSVIFQTKGVFSVMMDHSLDVIENVLDLFF